MCDHDKFSWKLGWYHTCDQCYEPEEVVIAKRELAAANARIKQLEADVILSEHVLEIHMEKVKQYKEALQSMLDIPDLPSDLATYEVTVLKHHAKVALGEIK